MIKYINIDTNTGLPCLIHTDERGAQRALKPGQETIIADAPPTPQHWWSDELQAWQAPDGRTNLFLKEQAIRKLPMFLILKAIVKTLVLLCQHTGMSIPSELIQLKQKYDRIIANQ